MNQVPQLPPDVADRLADTFEWLAKLGGSLLIVWGFVARVLKPYRAWRQRQLCGAMRVALEPELKLIGALKDGAESANTKLMLSLERQEQVFEELDLFVTVVTDLRDRADETNELLDASGFTHDRRHAGERRHQADTALAELQGQLRSRRRREDNVRNLEDIS